MKRVYILTCENSIIFVSSKFSNITEFLKDDFDKTSMMVSNPRYIYSDSFHGFDIYKLEAFNMSTEEYEELEGYLLYIGFMDLIDPIFANLG